MSSTPQLYMFWRGTEVSEARELASCLLATWLPSIWRTGSCQLSSSQVLRKKHLNILEVSRSQMLTTEVGWSGPKSLLWPLSVSQSPPAPEDTEALSQLS